MPAELWGLRCSRASWIWAADGALPAPCERIAAAGRASRYAAKPNPSRGAPCCAAAAAAPRRLVDPHLGVQGVQLLRKGRGKLCRIAGASRCCPLPYRPRRCRQGSRRIPVNPPWTVRSPAGGGGGCQALQDTLREPEVLHLVRIGRKGRGLVGFVQCANQAGRSLACPLPLRKVACSSTRCRLLVLCMSFFLRPASRGEAAGSSGGSAAGFSAVAVVVSSAACLANASSRIFLEISASALLS